MNYGVLAVKDPVCHFNPRWCWWYRLAVQYRVLLIETLRVLKCNFPVTFWWHDCFHFVIWSLFFFCYRGAVYSGCRMSFYEYIRDNIFKKEPNGKFPLWWVQGVFHSLQERKHLQTCSLNLSLMAFIAYRISSIISHLRLAHALMSWTSALSNNFCPRIGPADQNKQLMKLQLKMSNIY